MNKKLSFVIIAILIVGFAGLWFRSNQMNDSYVEITNNYNNGDVALNSDKVDLEAINSNELIPDNSNNGDQSQPTSYVDLDAAKSYELITNNAEVVIIDVSPRFDKGHIPGALNYYIGDGSLEKAIPNLDKQKTYLVYCHVDSASIPGAQKLVDAGFTKVYRLQGNYPDWLSGGYPIEVEISSVGKYTGTALAQRSYIKGQFNHSILAELADPEAGKFYEGWLVKGTKFFSTGKMEKQNGKYFLNFSSEKDSRDYKSIVITEETELNGLDGKPESHVLEGKFE